MKNFNDYFSRGKIIAVYFVLSLFIFTGCAEENVSDEIEDLTTTTEDYEEAMEDSPIRNGDISKLDELIKKGEEELEKGNLKAAQEYADSAESLVKKIEGYTK